MPTVAQATRFLIKYSDLLGIVAVLPVISHVKFSGMLEQHAAATPAKAGEEEEKKTEQAVASEAKDGKKKSTATAEAEVKSSTPAAEEPGYLPPAWALSLILVAELLAASGLFDASDQKVRRAAGAVLRQQKQAQGKGTDLTKAFRVVDFLLADEDIYYVIRSIGALCACGSLLLSALARLDRLPGVGKSTPGPLAAAIHAIRHLLQALLRPRLLFLTVLVAATSIGHKSLLLKVAKKPGVSELVYALPALLRATGLTGVALSPDSSILPTYAAMNCIAALARQAHILMYERIALPTLFTLELFDAKAKHLGPKTVLAMELWSMLVLIPMALRKRRFLMLLPILAIPCILLVSEQPLPAVIDKHIDIVTMRMVFSTAIMALLVLFLGGLQSMTVLVVLVQVLTRIHKLDMIKF